MDPVLSGVSASIHDTTAMDASIPATTSSDSSASATVITSATAAPIPTTTTTTSTATLPSIPATLPRDCKDLIALLSSMGLAYHPSILPLLLDHYTQLTTALLTHLHTTTTHTHHTPTTHTDTTTLITAFAAASPHAPTLPPPLELMLPLAVARNGVPLPLLRLRGEKGEVMLPPDRFLLTHAGWGVEVGEERRRGGQRGQRVGMEEEGRDVDGAGTAAANGNGSAVS